MNLVTYLDGDNPIETLLLELVIYYIPSNDSKILKSLLLGFGVNIQLLGSGV